MSPARPSLTLTRAGILGHRRRANVLDERLPWSSASLRTAAWAGLSDSMPRAAVLSVHARVEDATAGVWEDPAFVQVWGPRFSAYVVPAEDVAPFTLGRLPDDPKGRHRAEEAADSLEAVLAGRTMRYGDAGRAAGRHGNMFRYGAPTGRIRIRWDGARQPTVWMAPAPDVEPHAARAELLRRYLHVIGPGTPAAFGQWAGIKAPRARAAFDDLAAELVPVATPVGDGWILARDEESFRAEPSPTTAVRLLPSGDVYFLLWNADRELLVPDAQRRSELWTPRVWPGALLGGGEVFGVWRRAGASVDVTAWRPVSDAERAAVEAEAATLPLPDIKGPIRVAWTG